MDLLVGLGYLVYFLARAVGALFEACGFAAGRMAAERVQCRARLDMNIAALRKAPPEGVRVEPRKGKLPHAPIEVDGVRGEVSCSSAGTRLSFDWRPSGRLHLTPERWADAVWILLGGEDHAVGEAAFDMRFRIRGAPVHWIRGVLDAPTRNLIHRLATLVQDGETETLRVEAGPSGLTVSCSVHPPQLEEFVAGAAGLLRRMRALEAPGLQCVGTGETAAGGRCPVCNEALAETLRRCADCRTLHHKDCWDYLGGCAMFGCQSTRSVSERI